MTMGISIRSDAIAASLALSSMRSGDPGRYVLFGSFTGWGTREDPANALDARSAGAGSPGEGRTVSEGVGWVPM
jgi:hypothetical protein